ncbi:TetR/AcrR family transcriptional regulator [soil metagenome]
MPRAGLSNDAVIEEASSILDEHGFEGLTLAALAENLGVRIPSLYKHVDGMPAIQRGIMIAAKTSLSNTLGHAAIGKSRDEAITALSIAYRNWALGHPGQYPMTVRAPIAGDEQDLVASTALVTVVFTVLAGYELRGDDAVDATRFLRAALHGFVALETGGAFELPVDLEHSFQRLVESVVTALATWSRFE